MRNKFAGKCLKCGKQVKSGEGFFQKLTDGVKGYGVKKWAVRCKQCVGTGNLVLTRR